MKVSDYKDSNFLKKYQKEIRARQTICFREIKKLLKPVKGKKIIDLGCGPGNMSKDLFILGASVIGIDQSNGWIKICKDKYKESNNLKFVTADAENLSFIKSHSVDAVVLNLVLPNVETLKKVGKIFEEVGRILKKGGIFIFSDLHPTLIMSPKISPDRYQKYSKDFSYFKNDSEFTAGIKIKNSGKDKIEFLNKHWTLETYSDLLVKNGMYIYKISEPTYGKGDPEILRAYKIPEYIMFGCKKIS